METVQKSRIHPLTAGAAIAVIIASAVGVVAMTGHLPGSKAEPAAAPQVSAAPPAPPLAVQAESAEHRAAREQGAREQAARQQGAREQAARDRARHQQMAEASQQPREQPRPNCPNCGVVESVNAVQQKGEGGMVGMIGGGVAGALVGSQIGRGRGKTVAELAVAAGGALLGNEIEKKVHTTTHYDVVVRMDGGGSQTVSYAAQPGFSAGSHVRVENGTLVQN